MAVRFAGLTLIVLLAGLVAGMILVARAKRRRLQFSLRTLLLGVSLVAIAFSAVLSWNYLTTARTTWLDPASSEAAGFTPDTVIIKKDGDYTATFTPRFRNVQELLRVSEKAQLPPGSRLNTSVGFNNQQVQFEASERKPLEDRLALLKTNDVLMPGCFVIRGRVEDAKGLPVPGATVGLLGSHVYVNYFRTRDDGTFLMPINPPPGRGYYLQIRYGANKDQRCINTQTFRIEAENPEMAVVIQVPAIGS